MRYDLAAMSRRARNIRRSAIVLREVSAPAMLATDLFNSVYRGVIQVWTQAAPSIIDEYARTLASLTTDAPADIQAQIDGAEAAFQRLFFALMPSLRDWTLKVESSVRSKWRGAILSATGVDLQTMLGPDDVRDTLDAYLRWNVDLVADVSAQIKKRISDAVFSGLTQRKPAREVAKEISDAVGMGRDRARRIAADQLSKLSNSLADERRREAGIEVWAWIHSGKLHPRAQHVARDGVYYSDVAANVGKSVDGRTVNAPPERGDRPGQPPYCGCRSRSVLVFEFDE